MKAEYPDRKDYFDIIFSEIKRIDSVLGELLVLAKPHQVQFKRSKSIRFFSKWQRFLRRTPCFPTLRSKSVSARGGVGNKR